MLRNNTHYDDSQAFVLFYNKKTKKRKKSTHLTAKNWSEQEPATYEAESGEKTNFHHLKKLVILVNFSLGQTTGFTYLSILEVWWNIKMHLITTICLLRRFRLQMEFKYCNTFIRLYLQDITVIDLKYNHKQYCCNMFFRHFTTKRLP